MRTFAPILHGIIDRRMLVNFRAQPDAICKILPGQFRPKLVKGWAMAGVCLIRLKNIRPRGFPCGFTSENAAHRIAVEWEENGITREGVFIPRRDTSSAMQAFAGEQFSLGVHHVAKFDVIEGDGGYQVQMRSRYGAAFVEVHAHRASRIPVTSIFASLDEASEFFARGSVGFSAARNPTCCDGLELFTSSWEVEPMDVQSVRSSFFEDTKRFPKGTIYFDCALLMRNIEHEWHVLPRMERKL